MTKKLILYFIILGGLGIISSCSSSRRIQSILISEYSVDNAENVNKLPRSETLIRYDGNGKEILYQELNKKNGQIKFDIIKESHYGDNGKLKLIHENYKYSNQPARKDFKDSIEFKYNKNGLLEEQISYKPSGWDIDQKWTFNYDSEQRLIKKSLWSRYLSKVTDNPIAEYITYQYLSDTIIEKKFVKNKLCSTSTHYQANTDSITESTYDFRCIPKNKTIIKKHLSNDSKIKYTKYVEGNNVIFEKYDDNGNMTSRSNDLDSDKYEVLNEYIYDSFGNWISKTTYFRGKKTSVTLRAIEY